MLFRSDGIELHKQLSADMGRDRTHMADRMHYKKDDPLVIQVWQDFLLRWQLYVTLITLPANYEGAACDRLRLDNVLRKEDTVPLPRPVYLPKSWWDLSSEKEKDQKKEWQQHDDFVAEQTSQAPAVSKHKRSKEEVDNVTFRRQLQKLAYTVEDDMAVEQDVSEEVSNAVQLQAQKYINENSALGRLKSNPHLAMPHVALKATYGDQVWDAWTRMSDQANPWLLIEREDKEGARPSERCIHLCGVCSTRGWRTDTAVRACALPHNHVNEGALPETLSDEDKRILSFVHICRECCRFPDVYTKESTNAVIQNVQDYSRAHKRIVTGAALKRKYNTVVSVDELERKRHALVARVNHDNDTTEDPELRINTMTLDADLQRAITGMQEHAVAKGKTKRDRDDGSLLVEMTEESHALFYPKRVKTMTNVVKFAPEICVETIAMLHQWHQCRFCCQCNVDTMGEDELGGTRGWQMRRLSTLKPGEVSEMGGTHDDIKNLTIGDRAHVRDWPASATDVPPHICTGHKSGEHRRAPADRRINSPNYFTFPHNGYLYKHRTKDDDGCFAPYAANDEELREMKMKDYYIQTYKRNHVVHDWDASTCEVAYLVRGNGTGSVMSRLPLVLETVRPGYQFRKLYVDCEMPVADPSIEKIYHQQGGLLPHETSTYVILSPEEYNVLKQYHVLWKHVDSSQPGNQCDNFSFEITEDDVLAVDMPEICS